MWYRPDRLGAKAGAVALVLTGMGYGPVLVIASVAKLAKAPDLGSGAVSAKKKERPKDLRQTRMLDYPLRLSYAWYGFQSRVALYQSLPPATKRI